MSKRSQLIRHRRGSFKGETVIKSAEPVNMSRSHLPLLFIGMEHLQLSHSNLAEEYFLAAKTMCPRDPLLLNELGVVAYDKEEWVISVNLSSY